METKEVANEIYQPEKDGTLKLVDTSEKNNFADGIVLHWGGNIACLEEDFVIIGRRKSQWGTLYKTASLKNAHVHWVDAINIKFQTEDVWHKQHFFVTSKKLEEAEFFPIKNLADEYERKQKEDMARAKDKRLSKIQIGKGIALEIPPEAKALIVAEQEIDDCELQTDYFNVRTAKRIVLGYSIHTRNVFSEMRKFACKIEQTKHLAEKNEQYEHRENYSGGSGYFLKSSSHYSSGWIIRKEIKWHSEWSEEIYISLAESGGVI